MQTNFWVPLPERRIAAHETGHALVAWLSPLVLEVTGVSISEGKTRYAVVGNGGGDWLFTQLVVCAAGMAGEIAVFGSARSGPSASDLAAARGLAESLARQPGWPDYVYRSLASYPGETGLDLRAAFSDRLRSDVRQLLSAAYRFARGRINDNRAGFDRLMDALLRRRELGKDDVTALFGPRLWAPIRHP